jgi:hypothetical protein
VAISRTAYPGASREEAAHEADLATRHWNEKAEELGRLQLGLTREDKFYSDNFAWGTPEELAEDLLADPTLLLADEVILGIHPARHSIERT